MAHPDRCTASADAQLSGSGVITVLILNFARYEKCTRACKPTRRTNRSK